MRARLLRAWPVLSREFGVHPWDVGRLSLAELGQYLEAAEHMAREANRHR